MTRKPTIKEKELIANWQQLATMRKLLASLQDEAKQLDKEIKNLDDQIFDAQDITEVIDGIPIEIPQFSSNSFGVHLTDDPNRKNDRWASYCKNIGGNYNLEFFKPGPRYLSLPRSVSHNGLKITEEEAKQMAVNFVVRGRLPKGIQCRRFF